MVQVLYGTDEKWTTGIVGNVAFCERVVDQISPLAKLINPVVQGWINDYGKFYPSELKKVLSYVEDTLVRWAMGKYKKLRRRKKQAFCCLEESPKESRG